MFQIQSFVKIIFPQIHFIYSNITNNVINFFKSRIFRSYIYFLYRFSKTGAKNTFVIIPVDKNNFRIIIKFDCSFFYITIFIFKFFRISNRNSPFFNAASKASLTFSTLSDHLLTPSPCFSTKDATS